MEFLEFKSHFTSIRSAESIEGKHYSSIFVQADNIFYTRESGSSEFISLHELHQVYLNCNYINTSILRNYITGRKFSPSFAILIESGLYDSSGSRKAGTKVSPIVQGIDNRDSEDDEVQEKEPEEFNKDEGKFFAAFANLIGSEHIRAKSLFKPVTSSDITLKANHLNLALKKSFKENLDLMLDNLGNNEPLGNTSLERYIDGMVVDHPMLGTRIIEFDEEQHFTPARLDSLILLKEIEDFPFLDLYIQLCEYLPYLNGFVLTKHRIKEKFEGPVSNFKNFQNWLEAITPPGKKNGYIAPKPGFKFIGGRIAQRAYYDSLRDVIHHTNNISKLQAIIRFPKLYTRIALKKDFSETSTAELQKLISEYLLSYYNLKIQ